MTASDDDQERRLAVLLLDGSRSGAGADRVPTDGSLSSDATFGGAGAETPASTGKSVASHAWNMLGFDPRLR